MQSGTFGIMEDGTIVLVGTLDYESLTTYNLTIEASDGGITNSRKSSVTVTIDVVDVNDNPPVFVVDFGSQGITISEVYYISLDTSSFRNPFFTYLSPLPSLLPSPTPPSPLHLSPIQDTQPGSQVVQLGATDEDSGENGKVSFRIVNQDSNPDFILDPTSGLLQTIRTLDRETTPLYTVS